MNKNNGPTYIATQVYPELDPATKYLPYGQAKYGSLKWGYPHHWESFRSMHDRCHRRGIQVADHFRQNRQGFWNFIKYMGPIPEGMTCPTVGRLDHQRGYVRGNIRWQSRSANSREAADRRHLPQRHTRLKGLVGASPDLTWLGITWLKSTTISLWWGLSGEPCRSHNVPRVLKELANTFKGQFTWRIAEKGRGRRPHLIEIRMSHELIELVESYEDGT